MVDIILEGIEIKEKKSERGLGETYRLNAVEILKHLSELRGPAFAGCVANGRKFKIVVQGSKLPEDDAPWIRTE